jgi:DNA-binding winged helix-turn-helix (wHTH) protein
MPPSQLSPVYEFLDFRLDCGRFELLRNGHTVRMERKPMELLILLASREGQLVTRAEIAERLWSSEVFVDTEHGINTAIRKVRTVLRDDPENPRFVQTVTGMGYRFVAPLSAVLPRPAAPPESAPVVPSHPGRKTGWYIAVGVSLILAIAGGLIYRREHRLPGLLYTQLTDFTDSAVAPALSPDGHMLAFIRGDRGFLSTDQIYVMMLPDGEARRLSEDARPKYGLAFSPDGSQIAYTAMDSSGFSTYEVSALGGESHLLLNNAAGLTWLDPQHLLFSQIQSGIHMGVVTAAASGDNLRQIYLPAHERAMAHFSLPSPSHQFALVVEMNASGGWSPCKLVPLSGQGGARAVGPTAPCTSAGWSTDGSWMYFTATVDGRSHIWRQHFADGEPEQLTFGPTEEDGLAVSPDGKSLITSVGIHQSSIWIHDEHGERQLSSEGEVVDWPSPPAFNADGTILYYLLRRDNDLHAELWSTTIASGKSGPVFSGAGGTAITAFGLSFDSQRVVYTAVGRDGKTQLWIAPLDQNAPPARVNVNGAQRPHFGPHGEILFQKTEGDLNYLEQINPDGSHDSRTLPYPVEEFEGASPSGRWVAVAVPSAQAKDLPKIMAVPLDGGTPRRICSVFCVARWSSDGRSLVVPVEDTSRNSAGRSLVIPVGAGDSLTSLPKDGIPPSALPGIVPGAQSIAHAAPVSKDAEHYAWVNTTVQRNLYRISLR